VVIAVFVYDPVAEFIESPQSWIYEFGYREFCNSYAAWPLPAVLDLLETVVGIFTM
jgi:hypothetical protein